MALDNLISFELTAAELTEIDAAIEKIAKIIDGKVINLTPEERSQYGRIANRTENWIDKVKGYMDGNDSLIPNYISKTEYDKDYSARKTLQPRLNKLNAIVESLDDTQKLISTDLYSNSIAFYRNLKVAAQQNVPGSTVMYQDLQAQFPGPGKKAAPTP